MALRMAALPALDGGNCEADSSTFCMMAALVCARERACPVFLWGLIDQS